MESVQGSDAAAVGRAIARQRAAGGRTCRAAKRNVAGYAGSVASWSLPCPGDGGISGDRQCYRRPGRRCKAGRHGTRDHRVLAQFCPVYRIPGVVAAFILVFTAPYGIHVVLAVAVRLDAIDLIVRHVQRDTSSAHAVADRDLAVRGRPHSLAMVDMMSVPVRIGIIEVEVALIAGILSRRSLVVVGTVVMLPTMVVVVFPPVIVVVLVALVLVVVRAGLAEPGADRLDDLNAAGIDDASRAGWNGFIRSAAIVVAALTIVGMSRGERQASQAEHKRHEEFCWLFHDVSFHK